MNDTSIMLLLGFIGSLIAIMTPIIKLNSSITKLNTTIDNNRTSKAKYEVSLEENEDEYFEKEELEIINELKKLKPVSRNIIYLYYYQGYKTKEIAKILNMNINTVSTNLSRAKQELKTILEEGGDNYGV